MANKTKNVVRAEIPFEVWAALSEAVGANCLPQVAADWVLKLGASFVLKEREARETRKGCITYREMCRVIAQVSSHLGVTISFSRDTWQQACDICYERGATLANFEQAIERHIRDTNSGRGHQFWIRKFASNTVVAAALSIKAKDKPIVVQTGDAPAEKTQATSAPLPKIVGHRVVLGVEVPVWDDGHVGQRVTLKHEATNV